MKHFINLSLRSEPEERMGLGALASCKRADHDVIQKVFLCNKHVFFLKDFCSVLSVVRSSVRRLRLLSTIAWFRGVFGGNLHRLLMLDVRLSLGNDLAHLGDVLLEMLVQAVSNLHPADKCEGTTSSHN